MKPWDEYDHVPYTCHFSEHHENMMAETWNDPISGMVPVDGGPSARQSMGSTFLRLRPRHTENDQQTTGLFSVVDDMCCHWSNAVATEEGMSTRPAFDKARIINGYGPDLFQTFSGKK